MVLVGSIICVLGLKNVSDIERMKNGVSLPAHIKILPAISFRALTNASYDKANSENKRVNPEFVSW